MPPLYQKPPLFERSLDLLFPPVCVGCRRPGRWICAPCWEGAPWTVRGGCRRCGDSVPGPLCAVCAGLDPAVERIDSVMRYEGVGREAVHTLKFHGRHAISGLLGRLMAGVVLDLPHLVVPVPLHRRRRQERGYDQAMLLARVVARQLSLPLVPALIRTRATSQQASLDAAARTRNVEGAFALTQEIRGQAILLVDDVFTTGATLEAAARPLLQAGASSVTALTFARTPLGD